MADITPRKTAKGIKYEARWPNPDAPGKYRTKLFDKKGAAVAHLNNLTVFQAEEKKKAQVASTPTIEQAMKTWLHVAETTGIDGNDPVQRETLRHYKTEANHIIALKLLPAAEGVDDPDAGRAVKDIQIGELTAPLMMKIRAALLGAHSRKNSGRIFSRLRFALNEAVRQGEINTNPGQGVSVKIGSRLKEEVKIPEEFEVEALLKAAALGGLHNDELLAEPWRTNAHLICQIQVSAGLRPSEMRALARKSIRTDFPMIEVMQKAEEDGTISAPKTKKGRRVIRIQESLWLDILAWMERLPEDPDTLLFGTDRGNPHSLSNITNRLWWPLQVAAGIVDKAGEPKYIFYALRHFYASIEIALGANPKELQEAMGHEKIETTMNIYGHLFRMRDGGGQAARAEMRAKRLAGDRPDETTPKVVKFKRAS